MNTEPKSRLDLLIARSELLAHIADMTKHGKDDIDLLVLVTRLFAAEDALIDGQ